MEKCPLENINNIENKITMLQVFAAMDDEQDSDDSDEIKLSPSTLAALQEFYAEQNAPEHCLMQDDHCQLDDNPSEVVMPAEDWVTVS